MDQQATIFALATPRGRGGVAVIRISGAKAADVFPALGVSLPIPRKAVRHYYKSGTEILDDGISLWFPAPHSYTGENVGELQLHSSPSVIGEVMGILGRLEGFRLAEPGEFTKRAFLNGKIDLTAAEGVADLIDAETPAQRRQALRLMSGEAALQCLSWRDKILRALALFEAVLDFPDEDLPPEVLADSEEQIGALISELHSCLAAPPVAERIREGFFIPVLGAPNVGKSTLINALSERDMAIVSPVPGTTRDILESPINISGYPVILTDTAGLRESEDPIEREGIRRAREKAGTADFKLLLIDASMAEASFQAIQDHLSENALVIVNKCDSYAPQDAVGLLANKADLATILCVSLHTQRGVDEVRKALSEILASCYNPPLPVITRQRHRGLIQDAVRGLQQALTPLPLELRCEELRMASQFLGKMTGHIDTEEILGEIFKSFCIGK